MERVAVIGLGYVGLPVAVAMACQYDVVGFDIDTSRVDELQRGYDRTDEFTSTEIAESTLSTTCNPSMLADCTTFIVTVPTPIDAHKKPDLTIIKSACKTIGQHLNEGDVVIFESTVYPGVTEDICGPILEEVSGLQSGVDFHLGYSPERINPGDKAHRLQSIIKVVAGQDIPTLERVAALYEGIIDAGVHRASSIKVAEMAKVIENTQRDLNIALMNEISLICGRLDLNTKDVLEAAGTKWNFLPFTPGLVGGHCIGVDPYYLTECAKAAGYNPEVILAGRRTNDEMSHNVAVQLLQALSTSGVPHSQCRVGVLGITFKEDVPDIRNSRVFEIVAELAQWGVTTVVHDPLANPGEVRSCSGIELVGFEDLSDLDGLLIAVAHNEFKEIGNERILSTLKQNGVVFDVKWIINRDEMNSGITLLTL